MSRKLAEAWFAAFRGKDIDMLSQDRRPRYHLPVLIRKKHFLEFAHKDVC